MPVSESDLDYLDKWLSSDEAPPNSMMPSELDGFLTAIPIGPAVTLPSEWLPVLWGGGAPEFTNQMQAQRVVETQPLANAQRARSTCWHRLAMQGKSNECEPTAARGSHPDSSSTRGWSSGAEVTDDRVF